MERGSDFQLGETDDELKQKKYIGLLPLKIQLLDRSEVHQERRPCLQLRKYIVIPSCSLTVPQKRYD